MRGTKKRRQAKDSENKISAEFFSDDDDLGPDVKGVEQKAALASRPTLLLLLLLLLLDEITIFNMTKRNFLA